MTLLNVHRHLETFLVLKKTQNRRWLTAHSTVICHASSKVLIYQAEGWSHCTWQCCELFYHRWAEGASFGVYFEGTAKLCSVFWAAVRRRLFWCECDWHFPGQNVDGPSLYLHLFYLHPLHLYCKAVDDQQVLLSLLKRLSKEHGQCKEPGASPLPFHRLLIKWWRFLRMAGIVDHFVNMSTKTRPFNASLPCNAIRSVLKYVHKP